MRLRRVEIKNFRSIEEATIEFDPRCRILVGMNESGKSNILRAINVLNQPIDDPFEDAEFNIDSNDKRQTLKDEKELEYSYVGFLFDFEDSEVEELRNELLKKIAINKDSEIIWQHEEEAVTFKDFYSKKIQCFFIVDYMLEKKYFYDFSSAFRLEKSKHSLSPSWQKINTSLPKSFTIHHNKKDIDIKNFSFVNTKNYDSIPQDFFEEVEQDYFNSEIIQLREKKIFEIARKKIPKVTFWEHFKENILPSSIDIETFMNNPNECIPLRNMFYLYGTKSIKKEFEKNKSSTSYDNVAFTNYLDKVAHKTTNYFSEVWQDYKNIKFLLSVSGEKILCRVEEDIKYNFNQRSDGFLRFLSFLLMVSIKIKSDKTENNILLIDEPEVGLHPSSVRHLLQELIKISDNNTVVVSTHSTFMIDKNRIERHLIVKKEGEKTIAKSTSESNFFTEEVLHNALGTSMFDVMKAEILLFEGYWDKKLFEVFTEAKKIRSEFDQLGVANGLGIDTIPQVLINFALSARKCLVISDNDSKGKKGQQKHSKEKQFGDWKKYSDFDKDVSEITGEDFVCDEHILNSIAKAVDLVEKNNGNVIFLQENNLHSLNFRNVDLKNNKGKMSLIEDFIEQKYKTKGEKKDIIEKVKKEIFENLTEKHILEPYAKIVLGIAKHFGLKTESIVEILKEPASENTKNNERATESTAQEDTNKETSNKVSDGKEDITSRSQDNPPPSS